MNEVILTYLNLPQTVNGLVVPTPEGDYQIILNAHHSKAKQQQTFDHELRHILHNHFAKQDAALATLEQQASREDHLRRIIRQVEDTGLSQRDFAGSKPPPPNPKGEAKAVTPPAPPAKAVPANPILLRAIRAQLTGLHY